MKRKNKKRIEYRRRYWVTHPWAKTYQSLSGRCSSNPYYNGKFRLVKNFLSTDKVKQLWFRDKAYLMKQPSIDRIDNNGNYSLNNCRFIEFKQNLQRKKNSKFRKIYNYSLEELARLLKLRNSTCIKLHREGKLQILLKKR